MKYILVAASDINHSPYLTFYIDLFKAYNIPFNVIKWNKYGDENQQEYEYSFDKVYDIKTNYYSKFKLYLFYILFILKILRKNRDSKIIAFTIPLITFLSPFLLLFRRNGFYLDIRDYSFSYNNLLFKALNKYSLGIIVSSNGFKKWLNIDSDKVLINHNVTSTISEQTDFNKNKNILSIGTIRDASETSNLIHCLVDYKFIFVGNGPMYCELKNRFENNLGERVEFKGGYRKVEEGNFLNDISFINSTLDINFNNKHVLTNRLYLASSNYIPQIINSGTYMSEVVESFSLGIVYKCISELPKLIDNFYADTTFEIFKHNCDRFSEFVEIENQILRNEIIKS